MGVVRVLARRVAASDAAVLALALAQFAAILALGLVVDIHGESLGILYGAPIALLAVRFGVLAGLAGGLLALGLVEVWILADSVDLGLLGWLARTVVFLLLGASLGGYAERLRRAEAAQRRRTLEAPEAVVDVDASGALVAVNPEAELLLGAPARDLVGRSIASIVPERLRGRRDQALAFLADPGFRLLDDVEGLCVVRADGTEVPVDVTVLPRTSTQGAVVRVLVRDATAQRHAHAVLRNTAALLSAAEEVGEMGSWEWDLATGHQRWSDELYRLFGLEPGVVPPSFGAFLEAVHPDDRGIVTEAGRRALEKGEVSADEFRIVRPEGEVRIVEGVGRAILDAAGRTTSVIGTTRDITRRKHSEEQVTAAAAAQARAERTRQVLQITDVALSSLSLDALLSEILRRACSALPADSASLLLVDPATRQLGERASSGASPGDQPAIGAARLQLAAKVIEARTPRAHWGSPTWMIAGAPLLADRAVIGVLVVERRAPGLAGDELALLQLAADRTALAIDHARVFERERSIAHTLQQSLLPRRLPRIPGIDVAAIFRPAGEGQEVGGDFYDAFPLADGRWMLVVGDVCGKGAEAAALTALVRYTLRAEAMHEPRPGELLGLLNDAILVQRSDGRFCTVVLLVLDTAGRTPNVTVASGGHPMPLVLRADEALELSALSGGPLVGVLEDAEFAQEHHPLRSGDTLVAYTDGLLDAHAPDRILTAADILTAARGCDPRPLVHFLYALETAAIGTTTDPVRDDIAILGVALDGRMPSRA